MPTDLQTIESYWSLEEAEIARGFLASEGIRCQLDGLATAGLWHLNNATGGVKLTTLQQDAERATALLRGIEHHLESGPDDAAEPWQDDDPAIEDDSEPGRAKPTNEVEDPEFDQSVEDPDGVEYGSVLESLRSQKWAIILAFIVLILSGI